MDYTVQSLVSAKRNSVRRRRLTEALWGYIFLFPQLLGLLAFSLVPLVTVFYLSSVKWDGLGPIQFVGLQNFIEQFAPDSDLRIALINTSYYVLITVPGGIILALLIALGLNKVRGKTLYRVLYFMPYITSGVAVSVIWLWLLNGDFGLINTLLRVWLHIQGPSWLTDQRFVIPSIAVVSIWQGLGFNMVVLLAGLRNIPATYAEAARVDGANRLQLFWRVTLPLLSPIVFLVTVLSIIGSLQVFDQVFILTGGGPGKDSYTMVYHIYHQAFVEFQFGSASASAVILFVLILLLTLIQFALRKRWVYYES
ncbi:MAG TPA: sugar ABC transporter permease [Ktedonobacteraceae bacterium]|nr:sugar ABC transporter permease [Ktedonobacteraceae bacterium]